MLKFIGKCGKSRILLLCKIMKVKYSEIIVCLVVKNDKGESVGPPHIARNTGSMDPPWPSEAPSGYGCHGPVIEKGEATAASTPHSLFRVKAKLNFKGERGCGRPPGRRF